MQKGDFRSQPEFPTELKLRPRPRTTVQLKVPTDAYENREQIAAARDMSVDALIKLYIGQGLRQDLAQRFADRVLDLTAQVLARHGQSPEQVEAILRSAPEAGWRVAAALREGGAPAILCIAAVTLERHGRWQLTHARKICA